MKRLAALVLAIAILLPEGLALASDTSGALYKMGITITNSSAAATNVSTMATISTPNLIAGGFSNNAATNLAMRSAAGADVAFMPGYNSNPWVVFVPSIGASAQINYTLYTDASTGGTLRYFPGATGMTSPDAASMELGNNFEVEDKGFFETGASAVGAYSDKKTSAFTTMVSAVGIIQSSVYTYGSATNYYLLPAGVGDYTNINSQTPNDGQPHWQKVDDPVGAPDDSTTYLADTTASSWEQDAFTTNWNSLGVPAGSILNSFQVVWRASDMDPVTYNSYFRAGVRLAGVETIGSSQSPGTFTNYTETPARPGGGSWTLADMASVQLVAGVEYYQAGVRFTQIYGVANITPLLSVTVSATGIASGAHTVKTTADGTYLKIFVDGTEKGSSPLNGASVYNNSNAYTFAEAAAVPYLEYHKVTVNSTLKQHIIWQHWQVAGSTLTNGTGIATGSPVSLAYGNSTITVTQIGNFTVTLPSGINGTAATGSTTVTGSPQALVEGNNTVTTTTAMGTFTINLFPVFKDQSGNNNNATPSFRTTSSSANVSAAAVSFQPMTEAKAPAWSLGASSPWLTDVPPLSGNFTSSNTTTATYPGAAIIAALAAAASTPKELPLNLMGGFVILALSMSVGATLRRNAAMSLLVKGFVVALLMGIAVALKVFDFWMIVLFAYFGITLAMASTDPRWG